MPTAPTTIVNVGYRSTNYWVIGAGASRVLVDLGYPGTMGTLRARLTQMTVPLAELRYAIATHYHMDHAGLAQDLKLTGLPLLVVDVQTLAIAALNEFMRAHPPFTDITLQDNVVVTCGDSRALLAHIGIHGEIVHTPGHSDDSVSLLLDNGAAFTGDLTPAGWADDASADQVQRSWEALGQRGARIIYPGHGPVRPFTPAPGA
jgi:endoribonuclease LACTB2